MTSKEIKNLPMTENGDKFFEEFWLREIAYQLAVMNERSDDDITSASKGRESDFPVCYGVFKCESCGAVHTHNYSKKGQNQ